MKTIPAAAATLFLAVLALPPVDAQTAGALTPRPPSPPSSPAPPAAPASVGTPGAPKATANSSRGVGTEIADQVEVLIKDAARTANDAVRSALRTAQATYWEPDPTALQFGGGARSSSRSLVIQTTSTDPERIEDIEEDLSVMARILQKAARSLREDDRYNAMGIDLDSSVFGSASGARNLYLEGHGALFLLSVKYPLVGASDDAAGDPPAPAPDTEWERTRDEILGPGAGGDPGHEHELVTVFRGNRAKPEPFDDRKVAGLKLALLNALTNASNIRYLADGEFVTVVVQGGDVMEGPVKVVTTTSNSNGPNPNGREDVRVRKEVRFNAAAGRKPAPKGESIMTLRVKKSDLNALAAGRITNDEFRENASVLTSLRRLDTGRPGRR